MSGKERGRGFTSIQDSVDALINDLKTTWERTEEDWLQPPDNSDEYRQHRQHKRQQNKNNK